MFLLFMVEPDRVPAASNAQEIDEYMSRLKLQHSILPLPQTCPAFCISCPGGDATICTATNTRNFPATLDSILSSFCLSSPLLTRHFYLLKSS